MIRKLLTVALSGALVAPPAAQSQPRVASAGGSAPVSIAVGPESVQPQLPAPGLQFENPALGGLFQAMGSLTPETMTSNSLDPIMEQLKVLPPDAVLSIAHAINVINLLSPKELPVILAANAQAFEHQKYVSNILVVGQLLTMAPGGNHARQIRAALMDALEGNRSVPHVESALSSLRRFGVETEGSPMREAIKAGLGPSLAAARSFAGEGRGRGIEKLPDEALSHDAVAGHQGLSPAERAGLSGVSPGLMLPAALPLPAPELAAPTNPAVPQPIPAAQVPLEPQALAYAPSFAEEKLYKVDMVRAEPRTSGLQQQRPGLHRNGYAYAAPLLALAGFGLGAAGILVYPAAPLLGSLLTVASAFVIFITPQIGDYLERPDFVGRFRATVSDWKEGLAVYRQGYRRRSGKPEPLFRNLWISSSRELGFLPKGHRIRLGENPGRITLDTGGQDGISGNGETGVDHHQYDPQDPRSLVSTAGLFWERYRAFQRHASGVVGSEDDPLSGLPNYRDMKGIYIHGQPDLDAYLSAAMANAYMTSGRLPDMAELAKYVDLWDTGRLKFKDGAASRQSLGTLVSGLDQVAEDLLLKKISGGRAWGTLTAERRSLYFESLDRFKTELVTKFLGELLAFNRYLVNGKDGDIRMDAKAVPDAVIEIPGLEAQNMRGLFRAAGEKMDKDLNLFEGEIKRSRDALLRLPGAAVPLEMKVTRNAASKGYFDYLYLRGLRGGVVLHANELGWLPGFRADPAFPADPEHPERTPPNPLIKVGKAVVAVNPEGQARLGRFAAFMEKMERRRRKELREEAASRGEGEQAAQRLPQQGSDAPFWKLIPSGTLIVTTAGSVFSEDDILDLMAIFNQVEAIIATLNSYRAKLDHIIAMAIPPYRIEGIAGVGDKARLAAVVGSILDDIDRGKRLFDPSAAAPMRRTQLDLVDRLRRELINLIPEAGNAARSP